jgi:hypothetical protein
MSPASLSRALTITVWLAQLVAAAILGSAGLAKLTGNPDAVALFTTLGVEPWGRVTLGTVEVTTALLLLWPRTAGRAALLALVLMTGAIATHLFKIGIVYNGDASLFVMALIVFVAAATTVYLRLIRGSATGAP